jgi:mannose-6-phosphate isomerase-like protein (cupin superfamily)
MNDTKVLFIPQLRELCESTVENGPQWGTATDDLNLTVLSWKEGQGVAEHVNNELDVLWIALQGSADVTVDGKIHQLQQGGAIVVPRGAARALKSTSAEFNYISIHKRRAGLQITSRL